MKISPIKLVHIERNLSPIQILRKTFRWNPSCQRKTTRYRGKKKSLQTHQRKHRNWRSNGGDGGMVEHGNSYRYSGWRMDERYSSKWWYLCLLISSFQHFLCAMRQLYNFFFDLCRSSITNCIGFANWWHWRNKYDGSCASFVV